MPTNLSIFQGNHVQRNTRAPSELFVCERNTGTALTQEPSFIFGTVQSADAAGACVYLKSDGSYATADPSDATKMPAIGYLEEKLSQTSGAIRPLNQVGEVTLASLTTGTAYVVGSDGLPAKFGGSNYPAAGSTIQQIGFALSSTILLLVPGIGSGSGGDASYQQTAAGTALTNTITETSLSTYTIKAGALRAGSEIDVVFSGIATATHSTDTLVGKLTLGGSADILGMTALDVADNAIMTARVKIVCRSTTAFFCEGYSFIGAPGTQAYRPVKQTTLVQDATLDQVLKMTGTWSVADAGNSVRSDIFSVKVRR